MKKLLKTVKEWYVQGLSWLEDGYMQVVYIAAIISELLILHKIDSDNAIVYTGMLGLHVILLYVLGYKKSCWEGDTKEYIYWDIFFAANLIIMIVGAILTGIIKAVLIMLIPIAISFVQLMLAQVLFYSYEYAKHFKIEKWLINLVFWSVTFLSGLHCCGSFVIFSMESNCRICDCCRLYCKCASYFQRSR